MTPEEKTLLEQLFHKLEATQTPIEDAQADALIRRALAERPALAYRLAQHALLQDIALREAQRRIADLQAASQASPQAGGGSFLGRFLGSENKTEKQPAAGYRANTAQGSEPRTAARTIQGGPAAGGFLRSAASTAAGVAAGGLLFSGLSHLFGEAEHGFGEHPEEVAQNDVLANEPGEPGGAGLDAGEDAARQGGGWSTDSAGDALADGSDSGGWSNDPAASGGAYQDDAGGWGDDGFDDGGFDDGDWG